MFTFQYITWRSNPSNVYISGQKKINFGSSRKLLIKNNVIILDGPPL